MDKHGERGPRLYIFAGPNGSGKTTIAQRILSDIDPPLPFVNVDDIARELSPGHVETAAVEAGRIAIQRMTVLLEAGVSFALETTLSGSYHLRLVRQARDRGWHTDLTFIYLSRPETNVARVALRVRAGGHHVPASDVVRRHGRSLENLWNVIHFCERWLVLENSGLAPRLIAVKSSSNGTVVHDQASFRWLEGFRRSPHAR